MTPTQVQIFVAVLGFLYAILGYFIKSLMNHWETRVTELKNELDAVKDALAVFVKEEAAKDASLTRLIDLKTEAVSNNVRLLEANIKSDAEILAITDGKYTTKHDFEMMLDQRSEWRALLLDRMNKGDELTERLRKFKDHDYNNDRAAMFMKVGELERILAVLENTMEHFSK